MGLVMQSNGDDPTKVEPAAFDKAIGTLQDAVDSGQIRRFTGNDYGDDLSSGNVAAAMAWSGDIVQLQLDNPNLEFVIPDAGGMIFTDNMLIPTGGDVFTASTYMNFVYDPKIAAEIEDWVNYISPVEGAKEELLKIDPDVAKNPLIFPTDEMLVEGEGVRSGSSRQPGLQGKVPGRHRGLGGQPCSTAIAGPRRTCSSYRGSSGCPCSSSCPCTTWRRRR